MEPSREQLGFLTGLLPSSIIKIPRVLLSNTLEDNKNNKDNKDNKDKDDKDKDEEKFGTYSYAYIYL